jgi:thioredoxin-dependent peroxiredoxin
MLQKGDTLPAIKLQNQDGNEVSLLDFVGEKMVIYFYPKDLTSGCTAQACNLNENLVFWNNKGYKIIGISPDDAKSHQKFIQKHQLGFTLLCDTTHALAEAFGVWAEKKMMGRTYFGVLRTTFVVDEKGKITHKIEKIDTKNHTEQLKTLLNLL